jgi:hypothetical protein
VLWVVGLVLLYFFAMLTLGITAFSKGHGVMFMLGFVFPPLWLIGALSAPTAAATAPIPGGSGRGSRGSDTKARTFVEALIQYLRW